MIPGPKPFPFFGNMFLFYLPEGGKCLREFGRKCWHNFCSYHSDINATVENVVATKHTQTFGNLMQIHKCILS